MIDLLHNALSLLPESKRNLIRRLFFENESETEVARTLGISQPAVNKRKWTILDNLRKRLAPEKIS
jgi:RNA polymerase sigma factor (sigma-70 family)